MSNTLGRYYFQVKQLDRSISRSWCDRSAGRLHWSESIRTAAIGTNSAGEISNSKHPRPAKRSGQQKGTNRKRAGKQVYTDQRVVGQDLHAKILKEYCAKSEFSDGKWAQDYGCRKKTKSATQKPVSNPAPYLHQILILPHNPSPSKRIVIQPIQMFVYHCHPQILTVKTSPIATSEYCHQTLISLITTRMA